MKKTLIPLLMTSVLFADCTPEQEEQANNLWQESRSMQQTMERYQKLEQAMSLCNSNKIEVDILLFRVGNKLQGELSSENILNIEKTLEEIRSINTSLLDSHIRKENANTTRDLEYQLTEIQLKVETNQEKLNKLNAYVADDGEKKGFGEGETILIPINFANGKDSVIGNKNIDSLVRRIKHTLTKNKNTKFTITGYASSLGEAQDNIKLSKRRARNTINYIEQYIPKGKIIPFGQGESDLICNNGFAIDIGANEYECKGGSENEASSRRIEILRRN
jgi:outer membrane protein OmpA-like peptidoglycan-associated protein